jgi:hypothetical protein
MSVPHVKIVLPDAGHHELRLLDEVERVDADGRVRQSNGDRLRKAAAGVDRDHLDPVPRRLAAGVQPPTAGE